MSVRPPPGTVSLLEQHNATDRTHIVLVPHPSSDPNDPLNWSKWRKAFNFTLVLAASLSTFTSIMIQPVLWPDMTVTSNGKLTMTQLQHGQSVNLAGLACGCIFFIPLTIKYGRRLTYILSVATMAGSCWWISQRTTYWEVIVTSWFIGWAGAINETVAQMTIADLFFVHQRATANACYQMSVLLGCFLTPVAAGYQANAEGWRWCYIALGISQTILAIIFVFAYEETKYVRAAPISFDLNAASSDGKEGSISKVEVDIVHQTVASSVDDRSPTGQPNAQPKTYGQRMRLVTPTDESYWRLFIAPVKVLFLPHVFFTALQYASVICWLVMYSATSPVVFTAPPYNFTAAGLGNMLLGPLVGTMIGGVYGGPISDRLVVQLAKRNGGVFEPEMRLHLLLLTALSMAGGITMYGVTAARGMHWIYPSIGGALYGFGMTALGDISFTLVIDTYYELTAEAFVGVAFLRNALSIGMPSALTPWIAAVGFSNMFIIIGCLCLFIGMLYVPLLIWGKKIRTQLAPRYYHLVENRRFY